MSPRRIESVFVPDAVSPQGLEERDAIVIDVLRATTTIAHALHAGASAVLPVAEVEEAREAAARLGPGTLLCGEREGVRIAGFDLGNSPAEYRPEVVAGRTLVFCSTNGSRGMTRTAGSRDLALASFVNAARAAAWAAARTGDLLLVCSGKLGRPCLEDTACAGLLAEILLEGVPALEADDATRIALGVWRDRGRDPEAVLRESSHGRYLAGIGFAADLDRCAARDALPVLPVRREGLLVAY